MAIPQVSCCILVFTLTIVLWCRGTGAQCTEYPTTTPTIPDSFLPYGTEAGDMSLPDGPNQGDVTSSVISLSTPFRFYGYSYSTCYGKTHTGYYKITSYKELQQNPFFNAVTDGKPGNGPTSEHAPMRPQRQTFIAAEEVSVNGLLSFNAPVAGQASTVQFPIDQAIIAPYWADIVLNNNDGEIHYRSTTENLRSLTDDVRQKFSTPFRFTATQAVVVTWVNVTHKDGMCNSSVSTFQLVLLSDGRYSFVIFNYAGLGWNEGSAPATNPLVGFNVNTEYTHQLPNSGTADVTNLATTSNIGDNGVWMFRVDTRPFVIELCETNGDTLILSPDVASPQGGSRLLLSGPCITSSTNLKVKIDGTEVEVTRIADHRLEVIVPAFWKIAEVQVELSLDDGATYPLNSSLLIDVDPNLVPVVTRVDKDSWELSKDDVSITWDKDCIDAVNISIFFATYEINNDVVQEILYPLLLDVPNTGQADIEVNGLPLLDDAEFEKLVTFGSILVKESEGPSQVNEVRLYSDIHLAMWYVRIYFIELVTRNKLKPEANPEIAPSIWSEIKTKFANADGNEDKIKQTIKSTMIDICAMWMTLLEKVADSRCSQTQLNVAVTTPVPCARRQPMSDPGWMQYVVSPPRVECQQTQDTMCFIESGPNSMGASQQACYKMSDDKLMEGMVAGRPLSAHPDGMVFKDAPKKHWMVEHLLKDVEPMLFCCVWNKDHSAHCNRFRNVRPAATCDDYVVPTRGGGGGDPHLVTFDNVKYTFNGVGEFTLVKANTGGFVVQARLEPIKDSSGTALKATEITAIATKGDASDTVEVRYSLTTGLEVLIGGNDLPLLGRNQVLFNGGKLRLTYMGTQLVCVEICFTTREKVTVKQAHGSLSYVITPQNSQQGNLKGLLGDSDGNKGNDFTLPTGAVLSTTSTPQQIHDYGLLWITTEAESLFTYPDAMTHASYMDTDFEPSHPSNTMPIPSFCSGDIFCAYDYNVTGGDMQYAMATKRIFDELQTIQDDLNSGRDCTVLVLENGGFGSDRRVGDTVTATCIDGYAVVGSSTRTCRIDLTWSGTNTTCIRQARSCDDVECNNNGTCIEENGDAICKCTVGFVGSLCQEVVTDTNVVIIVGAVVGGLLLLAVVVAVVLLVRQRPNPRTDSGSEILKDYFGDVDGRYGVPVFKGTAARRQSYDRYNFDDHGYRPTVYGNKRFNDNHRRYTDGTIGTYRDDRYPYNGRQCNRGPPSDEDSIDKIYRGDYEQYPRPDYDTEYTSHIDRRHQSDFDESSGQKQQRRPPQPQGGNSNWELRR